ncbi:MAG: hypothetical protein NC079_08830 [Clostridium sp.]|nr:hypothetical protein [Clostridium sp.]
MATESIFHNIVIDDAQKAETFITALEQAAQTADHYPLRHVDSEDVKGEDIQKLLGVLVK